MMLSSPSGYPVVSGGSLDGSNAKARLSKPKSYPKTNKQTLSLFYCIRTSLKAQSCSGLKFNSLSSALLAAFLRDLITLQAHYAKE